MSASPKHYFTLDEYFALEKVGDARYEYWDGDIVCMSGGSKEHGIIGGNIYGQFYSQLRGKQCKAFTSEIPINTPALPPYRYPDVSVACGEADFGKISGIGTLNNPVVIIEVLSPHTEVADRGQKLQAYRAIETLKEYLLISQTRPHITHYIKQENGDWLSFDIVGITTTFRLESIDCSLTLSDVYEGINFN